MLEMAFNHGCIKLNIEGYFKKPLFSAFYYIV
jgi:hypothetical protein